VIVRATSDSDLERLHTELDLRFFGFLGPLEPPSREQLLEHLGIVQLKPFGEFIDVKHIRRETLSTHTYGKPWVAVIQTEERKSNSASRRQCLPIFFSAVPAGMVKRRSNAP